VQLVGVGGAVAYTVVDIIIGDAGAGTERYLAAEVGEEIQPVVVVVFGDGEVAVQHHPVDEVRELAHAAADALRGAPFGDGETFLVSLTLGGATDETPDRESLAGPDEESVDMLHRQREVGGLILLQLHIHVSQTAADERVMVIDEGGQQLLALLLSEAGISEEVLQMAFKDAFLHRETVGKRGYFAKQFSFHFHHADRKSALHFS